jgi:hypothetical protein
MRNEVLLRPALLAAGWRDSELQRDRRSGRLTVLRRGAYLLDDGVARDAEERHRLLVAAELARVSPEAVVSHVSAAVMHGLPVWGLPLTRVHVTRARPGGARLGPKVHVHAAPLRPDETAPMHGMAVTGVARTLVDLSRTAPFEVAVAVLDAALHDGLVGAQQMEEALVRAAGWRGVPAARRAVAFADDRAESVGESRSRVALRRAGIPAPTCQWEVDLGGGRSARTDFAWPDERTVAEFDGRVKYGRLLRPGQDPGEVVYQEKLREDALRAIGLRVVRWSWRDLDDFHPTAARLTAALTHPT